MQAITDGIRNIATLFKSFCSSVISILDYVYSIFKTLWFGLTSILTGIWNLISEVFNGTIFDYIGSGFSDLSFFIGTPAVIFISSLLLIIFISIGLSFVFKIFKMTINVNSMKTKWK